MLSLISFYTGKTHTLMSSDGMTAYLVSRLFAKISRDNNNVYEVRFKLYVNCTFIIDCESSNARNWDFIKMFSYSQFP